MNIDQARELKIGDRVMCPADSGNPAFKGRVSFVGEATYKRHGTEYVWITVRSDAGSRASRWPSHRLTSLSYMDGLFVSGIYDPFFNF